MISLRRLAIPLAVVLVGATTTAQAAEDPPKVVASCDQHVQPGEYTCFAQRRADLGFRAKALTAVPDGYGPSDLQAAYKLPSSGAGQRVYIVDAYDDPTAEQDLAVYREQFGLPACTTANGCFQKLNQDGLPSPLPAPSRSWSGEISLDLDMVSASCPKCSITLVEANSATDDLLEAVRTTNRLGAKFVSLSWGGPEASNLAQLDAEYFNPHGVVYAASTGDYDYEAGVSYPASSTATTAIGGTSLTRDDSARGWAETVWNNEPGHGTGSGCSSFLPKPAWQSVIPSAVCPKRAIADISAVADPATGVAVYQTTGGTGWGVYGGTSAAAPIIASIYALAGDPAPASRPGSYPYASSALNDVVQGNNGECTPAPLCTAQAGWDGPTGLGTPIGTRPLTSPVKSNHVTVTAPVQSFNAVGDLVLTHARSTDRVHYTSVGLPTGLRLEPNTGIIYGRPTSPGTYSATITATDATGARGNTVMNWVISTRAGSRGVVNGDFESGAGGWTQTPDVIRSDGQYSHSGLGYAWFGGGTATDTLTQQLTVPRFGHPTVRFALRIAGGTDVLHLTVNGQPAATFSGAGSGYQTRSVDLTKYRGKPVTITWTASGPTTFLLDDVSLS